MVTTPSLAPTILPAQDLAGPLWPQPTLWQTRRRIHHVVQHYLDVEVLGDRLDDLPHQLQSPRIRPWPKLDWSALSPDHIIGLAPHTFLRILLGIINTELPIRGYSQTSRQYLTAIHPGLARFVGGEVDSDNRVMCKGLWEQEEQRHGPALIRVYRLLAGTDPALDPHEPRPYTPSVTPYEDLYRHGMHRVATEYSATCLYLWLMAHTTGPLQQVFAELVKDEVNHMVKFWGAGMWLFPRKNRSAMIKRVIGTQLLSWLPAQQRSNQGSLAHIAHDLPPSDHDTFRTIPATDHSVDMRFMPRMLHTLQRMRQELAWAEWSAGHRLEFVYTFLAAIARLNQWSQTLTPSVLEARLGPLPTPLEQFSKEQ